MQETVRVGSDLHFLPSQTLNRAKVDASLRQRFSGNAFSTLVEVIVFTLGSPKSPFIYYVSTFLSTDTFSRNAILGRFIFFYALNFPTIAWKFLQISCLRHLSTNLFSPVHKNLVLWLFDAANCILMPPQDLEKVYDFYSEKIMNK